MLVYLAQRLNLSVDSGQAARATEVAWAEAGEPLEALIRAAEISGIRIQPLRVSLNDALWMARDDHPLVLWSPVEQGWLLLRRHGFFSAHIAYPDCPSEFQVVSRRALATRLGLASSAEVLDVGVATAERPAEGLRGQQVEQTAALLPSMQSQLDHLRQHDQHASPIRRYFGLMQPEMKDVWTIAIFSVISGLLYLAVPLAVNALVSNLAFGTQSAPFQQALVVIALAVFGFLLLSAIVRALQTYVAEVIQRRLFVRVAADMAYRLPRVKADSLDGVHAPEMVNRFLDVVTVQKSTALLLMDGLSLVLSAGIGLLVLGFYHPFLLTFTVMLLAALAVIVWGLGRHAVRTAIDESISKYDVVNWLEELARYPRLFKGPGGYAMATERADQLVHQFLCARRSHFRILFRQISGLLLVEVLASSALLMVGGWLVLSMQLTLGQLVAAELIVGGIVASIAKLGKQFEAWYDAMAAVDKLGHLIDLEIETEDGEIPLAQDVAFAVQVTNVGFQYDGGKEVFRDVCFDLPPGGRAALVGSQGSGCSTFLDLLLGLRYPTAGHLNIGGFDLRSWYLESLRGSVMLIRSQDIVHGTIAENVRLGRPGLGLEEVQRALTQVGLIDDVLAMPLGMHTLLVTGGVTLSSRQRTRLLLARALVLKPKLLLLDDVFDGMDTQSMDELTDTMLAPALPWTVIIATRDPRVAAKCSTTIDLDAPNCHPPTA